jgi:hypothetical protein
MRLLTCALLTALVALGCRDTRQSANLIPVTGTVTLNGKPLDNAVVSFLPQGDTRGGGGGSPTDAAGKYELHSKDGKGMVPGSYKVTISRRLMPDGSIPKRDVPPAESPARESLPPQYSDQEQTTLTATIAAGVGPIDFALKSGSRP